MQIMPELAVALRRELQETLSQQTGAAITLSIWSKARAERAEGYIASLMTALARPMKVTLWQKGAWGQATLARDEIGGELASFSDMEPEGQLWLFDAVTLPVAVKKRFLLPPGARTVARVLLPVGPPDTEKADELGLGSEQATALSGVGMGYLFRSAPSPGVREGVPFLRMLPDLYPGEFLADPHVNFAAARRYLERHARDVTPPGARKSGEKIWCVAAT